MITGQTGSTIQSKPEYVIYSFRKEEGQRGADTWQNMGASASIEQARERALSLFRSSHYSRIELRKKFISEKTGMAMDVPVEVFGDSPDRDIRSIVTLLVLAMSCALIALGLSIAVM